RWRFGVTSSLTGGAAWRVRGRTPVAPRSRHMMGDSPFLVLVGTYRSGTTSLFRYLSEHPQVAASSLKETGYFLPVNEPAPSRWGIGGGAVGPTLRMGRDPLN